MPNQSEPVASIRLVNQYLGTAPDGEYLRTITCRLTPKPTCSTDD
jgi:hypothetical protein